MSPELTWFVTSYSYEVAVLTPRAPSARYVACEWRYAGAVSEITRRTETPVVSPSATNLNQHWPAVPCHGNSIYHDHRCPDVKLHATRLQPRFRLPSFLFIKSLWGLPFLSKINYFDGPHIEFMQRSRCAYRAILIWNIKMILPLFRVMTSMYPVSYDCLNDSEYCLRPFRRQFRLRQLQ